MKINRLLFFTFLISIAACLPLTSLFGQNNEGKVSTIVIDPGHGGRHPGTTYGKIYEKNITLSIALKLGKLIKSNFSDVKVIYTRTTDKYIDLNVRGEIANNAKADLFLSIHVNASDNKSASGTQSFVMGIEKSAKNLDVAMRENDVIVYEDDYTTKYEGYVPGSALSYIIFSMMQYANTDQSMLFASIIQKHYNKNTPMRDRGASQDQFLVLWKTTMPAVLTEFGFLSNYNDRAFITTSKGQEKAARSLFNAFSEYKSNIENNMSPLQISENSDIAESTSADSKEINTENKDVIFTIQICSSPKKISLNSRELRPYNDKVIETKVGQGYKYSVGECTTYSEALKLQRKVRFNIKDAFTIALIDGEISTVAKAKALIE